MKNQPEPEEHNVELPHDRQPPMSELPQTDFHAGEVATDCPVCLEEFVEGKSLVKLPTCLHAFHSACIQTAKDESFALFGHMIPNVKILKEAFRSISFLHVR
ncbi:ring-h2 finger protein atl54 [Quercus suber]|uniref:Ring-h2 finger protein atl54 n=1 Tax=Quercus suber TaxID=58331 RepID=A0AAW0LCB1_QUESU